MGKAFQPNTMAGYSLPEYTYRTPPEVARGTTGAYPVIVVGAGLGGLTAALELGSRGIRTVLLDEDNSVGAAGLSSRGICYAKRTLEILDRFGVAQRVRDKGVTWNEGDVYRGKERLYRFNLQPEGEQKFPAFVNLQQFYVEQYLVEKLQQVPAVDLRWKNKVTAVRQDADGVHVTVQTPEGKYSCKARYLVAADGGHGVVREKLRARDADHALLEDHWCIADVRLAKKEVAVRKAFLDSDLNEGGAIWYHQMADGVWRTDWQISQYKRPDLEATPERARKRLQKLLGAKVKFELVWVGPWRFRKRYLAKMLHGRVLFLGDAAAQHSPFGARGGNRAIQDANNLGWKLALVLEDKAHPDLLQTYHDERHRAAREAVEIATRSAAFIGPENPDQRVFRDAMLDLAQNDEDMRSLVNVGRLSTACEYWDSPLNQPGPDGLDAPLAAPGCVAPDGKLGDAHLVDRLQGAFTTLLFGDGDGAIARKGNETLWARYGVPAEGATYVIRPDGHVLARCRGKDPAFAARAIEAALHYRAGGKRAAVPAPVTIHDRDRLYEEFEASLKGVPQKDRERAIARLAVALASRLPPEEAAEAIRATRPRKRMKR